MCIWLFHNKQHLSGIQRISLFISWRGCRKENKYSTLLLLLLVTNWPLVCIQQTQITWLTQGVGNTNANQFSVCRKQRFLKFCQILCMCVCTYACVSKCMNVRSCVYIHTYMHTCIQRDRHIYILFAYTYTKVTYTIHIPTHKHTYIHTCIHACMHTYIRRYIHTYTQTHFHIYIPTHIHTWMHTHIHSTYLHICVFKL